MEIKFRAWDVNNGKMINLPTFLMEKNGHYVVTTLDCCIKAECEGKEGCKHLDYDVDGYLDDGLYAYPGILMRFTSLTKNGQDVYEGDILKDHNIFWEVFWSQEKFGWFCRAKHAYGNTTNHRIYRPLFWMAKRDFKIVGNIWEKPELSQD